MTIHINAKKGDIAEKILLPGDPLRARYIAENMLENAICYSDVRGMFGYTGKYKGQKISVQGTGMGIPSISIYVNELITTYKVKSLIRIGTCATIQNNINLKDIILSQASSSDSSMNNLLFDNKINYAPIADFDLLLKSCQIAKKNNYRFKIGNVLSTDHFYMEQKEIWKQWAKYNIIAIEMETSALYTIAAKYNAKALSILTVCDNMINNKKISSKERQTSLDKMIDLALNTLTLP